MRTAKDFTARDKFCQFNAMEVISVDKGRARTSMEIKPHHLNGLGIVHGGAVFTLADLAFAAASNSGEDAVVSTNASITYLKAATAGILFAEAKEIARSRKLATYDIQVTNEAGELLAVMLGTGYIKSKTVHVTNSH